MQNPITVAKIWLQLQPQPQPKVHTAPLRVLAAGSLKEAIEYIRNSENTGPVYVALPQSVS